MDSSVRMMGYLQVVISNSGRLLAPSYLWWLSERAKLHQRFWFKQIVRSQLRTYYSQFSAIISVTGVETHEKNNA